MICRAGALALADSPTEWVMRSQGRGVGRAGGCARRARLLSGGRKSRQGRRTKTKTHEKKPNADNWLLCQLTTHNNSPGISLLLKSSPFPVVGFASTTRFCVFRPPDIRLSNLSHWLRFSQVARRVHTRWRGQLPDPLGSLAQEGSLPGGSSALGMGFGTSVRQYSKMR
jgi:hypothetical protein